MNVSSLTAAKFGLRKYSICKIPFVDLLFFIFFFCFKPTDPSRKAFLS